MADRKKATELNEQELDQVTGGAGLTILTTNFKGNVASATVATPKRTASGQYNPETITRTIHPVESSEPKS